MENGRRVLGSVGGLVGFVVGSHCPCLSAMLAGESLG